MGTKNKKFFKFDHLNGHEKLTPFKGTVFEADYAGQERANCEIGGALKSIAVLPSLITAAISYIEKEDDTFRGILQIGANSVGDGTEDIYVEYASPDNPSQVELVKYNPVSGKISAAVFNTVNRNFGPLKLDCTKKEKITDCTAIWLAILTSVINSPGWERITEEYNMIKAAMHSDISAKDGFEKGVIPISWDMYAAISLLDTIPIDIKNEDVQIHPALKKYDISSGKVGPAIGKDVFNGGWEVFTNTAAVEETPVMSVDWNKYKDYPWKVPFEKLDKNALSLVEGDDPTYTPSQNLVRLCDWIYNTRNDGKDKITQILLVGDSGCGKSTDARRAASIFKRPCITQSCGSNDTSDELIGMMLPVPKDLMSAEGLNEEDRSLAKAIKESTPYTIFDDCCKAMGLPNIFDISFDPEGSYEEITGETMPEGTSEQKIINLLSEKVLKAQENLQEKVQASGEVEYKFMPSNIVTAMINGYWLDLDEITNWRDAAVLSNLHEAFDTASNSRRIPTPVGDLFVHPDFVCITTANVGLEGNRRLNQASLNRLAQITIVYGAPEKDIMTARCKNRTGISSEDVLSKCFDVYDALRQAGEELHTPGILSPRDYFIFTRAVASGTNLETATRQALLNKLTLGGSKEDEEDMILQIEDLDLLEDIELR